MKHLSKISMILLILAANAFAQNPAIQNIIDAVKIDTLMKTVRELSGASQTIINQKTVTISSRYAHQVGNDVAADYIQQKLKSYGFAVVNQQYSSTGRNVFAQQTGTLYPDRKFILCAHYDSMPEEAVSPGADDNASGVAAVLEAARLLQKQSFEYSIVYALFDEEEIDDGYLGSYAYVGKYGANVSGVINIDMIGYDSDNDYLVDLHVRKKGNSVQLSNAMVDFNKTYQAGLDVNVVLPGLDESDQISFWDAGIGAVWISESDWDFSPYYHTKRDLVARMNSDYFLKCAKLSIGALASFATPISVTSVDGFAVRTPENYRLSQNYPNPFNPTTRIRYSIPNPETVGIKIVDLTGREVTTLLNEYQSAGVHEVLVDASTWPNGVYLYTITAGKYSETKKMAFIK
jgi:hypothetical protein